MIHSFGDCELDTERFELRRVGARQRVEPQVFDVLAYLVEHRERVVTREELLAQVWGHSYVSEATLSSRIMAARKAIGDSGRAQSLIRTVRGRGYRFVGEVREDERWRPARPVQGPAPVGRDEELDTLQRQLESALAGERRTIFVTGEAGIGKTTLVDAFLARARDGAAVLVARGFCLEHRGTGEAYMPVLEALGRLCAERAGAPLLEALRARAPTWLLQLPSLLTPDELERVRLAALAATSERMLRELAEALEAVTSDTSLVLVLEDLHWSDVSTLDLVSRLARRDEPARLLILGTYRPGGTDADALQRELRARGRCLKLDLPFLSGEAVREQLERRLDGGAFPSPLAGLVRRRTDGNPLFVECLVDSWLERGTLDRTAAGWELREEPGRLAKSIPDTLRDLIDQDVSRLSAEDLEVVEAASVVGTDFVGAAVPAEDVERGCSRLAGSGRLVRRLGEAVWAGEPSTRFAFIHDLHREVLYDRIPAGRRAELHRAVADRLEVGYGDEAPARAAEIAMHYVRGHSPPRAIEYLRLAAEQALRRSGHREAIRHLGGALQQLETARGLDEPERVELVLQAALGQALLLTQGFSSARAERALRRALELSERLGDERRLAGSLYALAGVMEFRGDYSASEELLARSLALRPRADPSADLEAHELMACSLFHQGHFGRAIEHARRGLELYAPSRVYDGPVAFGEDAVVSCHDWAGLALGCLGLFGEAEERIRAAIELADSPGRDYGLASALTHAGRLHQLSGEVEAVERDARRALALAEEHGFAYQAAVARMLLGWALAARGEEGQGLELLREGLERHRSTGAAMDRPYFLALLADASIAAGELEAARSALTEAIDSTGNGRPFFYEAELHRLRGELELRSGGGLAAAERHFQTGLEVARRHKARSLEFRTALSLARALHAAGRDTAAAAALAPLSDWLSAEDAGADRREARDLLQRGST